MRKVLYFIIVSIIAFFIVGNYFGLSKSKTYYNSFYHLYISTSFSENGKGRILIGREKDNMDNIITFKHFGDFPILFIIPIKDTLFVYDDGNSVLGASEKSLKIKRVKYIPKDSATIEGEKHYISFEFEDSFALKSQKPTIYIEWDGSPDIYVWSKDHYDIIKSRRILW